MAGKEKQERKTVMFPQGNLYTCSKCVAPSTRTSLISFTEAGALASKMVAVRCLV
jgi:hypothetical protein